MRGGVWTLPMGLPWAAESWPLMGSESGLFLGGISECSCSLSSLSAWGSLIFLLCGDPGPLHDELYVPWVQPVAGPTLLGLL